MIQYHSISQRLPATTEITYTLNPVRVCNGKWREFQPVSKFIKVWKVEELFLCMLWVYSAANHQPLLLLTLQDIRFSGLQILSLDNNQIQSVESLSRVYLPVLKNVTFGQNHVHTIRNLRKANWPSLCVFLLQNNHINEMQEIVTYSTKQLTLLSLEELYYNREQCPYLMYLIKLPTPSLQILEIKSQRRIRQNKLFPILKKKHKKLQKF